MEAQVYRKLCETLKSELLRLGFTRESLSSLWSSSSDSKLDIHSKLPSSLKDSENVTIVRENIVLLCYEEANENLNTVIKLVFKVHDSSAEMVHMLDAVLVHGMGMHAAFKEKDVSRSGNLNAILFKDALREASPGLALEDRDMVALKFQDPHTNEIDFEGVLKYFYKKASKISLKSPSTTSTMSLGPNKNNREQHLSKMSTATDKGTDECSSRPTLNNERTVVLTPPPPSELSATTAPRIEEAPTLLTPLPTGDTVQDKPLPFKFIPPLPPVEEVLDRLSIFMKNKWEHVEALMKEQDPYLAGVISTREFSEVLHSFTEIKLSRSERKILYDSFSQCGCVAYGEFLKRFTAQQSSQATSTYTIEMASTSNSTNGYR